MKPTEINDKIVRSLCLATGYVMLPLLVQAVTVTWTNTGDGEWKNGSNWSSGVAPSNNTVYITNALSKTVTVGVATPVDVLSNLSISVDAPSGATNTLLLAGTATPLVLSGSPSLTLAPNPGRIGSLVMADGYLVTSNSGIAYVGSSGVGLMTVQNGYWIGNQLHVGENIGSYGKLNLFGGTNSFIYTSVALQVGVDAGSVGEINLTNGMLVVTNGTSTIGSLGAATVNVSGGKLLLNGVNLGSSAGSDGKLKISGNGSVVFGATSYVGNSSGSTGSVEISGGVLITTNFTNFILGQKGVGSMTVSGGRWLADSVRLGNNSPTNSVTSKGTMTITGGEVLTPIGHTVTAGYVAGASNNAMVITGGLLDANSLVCQYGGGNIISNAGGIYQFATLTPTITTNGGPVVLNGGTISCRDLSAVDVRANQSGTQLANITYSAGGTNTFRLNNSTNSTSNQAYTFTPSLGATNYAKLDLVNGTTCYRAGSVTIGADGAMLVSNTLATFVSALTNYSANVNLTASTLTASNGIIWADGAAATTTAGTVVFDTYTTNKLGLGAGNFVTFNQSADATQVVNGVMLGAGNLTKSGPGVLILSASNLYTGATTVSNGLLLVNGSVTGAVTVASGSLGGKGTVYGVVTNSGSFVATITNVMGGASGSTYVSVNGAVVLLPGSTLSVSDPNGYLASSSGPYTVLYASGGVTPGGFTATLPHGWQLRYTANSVILNAGYPGTLIRIH